MSEEIIDVQHLHHEDHSHTVHEATTSSDIIEIDGKKYQRETTTTGSSDNMLIIDSTTTTTRSRSGNSMTISSSSFSQRDLLAFEAFSTLMRNIPAKPVRKEKYAVPEEQLVQDVSPLRDSLQQAQTAVTLVTSQADQVDVFCAQNISKLAYSRVLSSELSGTDQSSQTDPLKNADTNIFQILNAYKPRNTPKKSQKDIIETMQKAIQDTKAMGESYQNYQDNYKHNEETLEIVQEILSTTSKIEKNVNKLAEHPKESFQQKVAKHFQERIDSYYQTFYEASVVDEVAEYKTNFTYSFALIVANMQIMIDQLGSESHEPEEEAQPHREQHITLQEMARSGDEEEEGLSLNQSKPLSTSSDSLMKKNREQNHPNLGLNNFGSKSVSLFMLQSKRKSILLEPSNVNLIRSPTCPHVTFNFDVHGPLDQDDEEGDNEHSGVASSLLAQEPQAELVEGEESGRQEQEELPQELYPQQIKAPAFETWDPTRVQKAIEKQIRVPQVSLDKLKSHSAKRSKLGFLHSQSSSQLIADFNQIRCQSISDSYLTPVQNEMSDEQKMQNLEQCNQALEQLKEEYMPLKYEPIAAKLFFFQKSKSTLDEALPLINYFETAGQDSPTLRSAKTSATFFSTAINDVIDQIEIKDWESPRDALTHIHHLISIMVYALNAAEEDFTKKGPGSKSLGDESRVWKRYFSEVEHHISVVDAAYDNALVIMSHKFFDEMRSQWASFGSTAERIDTETKRRILLMTYKSLMSTTDYITNYLKSSKDLRSDVTDAPKMQSTIMQVRKKFQPVKMLRIRALAGLSTQVDPLLNQISTDIQTRKDIEFADCDRYSQQLQVITTKLEPEIKKLVYQPQFDKVLEFHEYLTVARNNLLTYLAHNSQEKDPDLSPLLKTNENDLEALIAQLQDEQSKNNGSRHATEVLCQKWIPYLQSIKSTLELIESVSNVVSRNTQRYEQIDQYLNDVVKRVRICDNQKFKDYVQISSAYSKMAANLQVTIDYVTDMNSKLKKTETSRTAPTTFVHGGAGLAPISVSNIEQSLTSTIQTVDLAPYDKGFVDEPNEMKASLQAALNQAQVDQQQADSHLTVLTNYISQLINAQIDALSRNYNLSTKSTSVLYKLAVTFCQSIIEITPLLELAVHTKKLTDVKASVDKSIKKLNAIQSSYNDKSVYSDFAQKRLGIFALTCKVLGQVTGMNIHHLNPEAKFNDSPLQSDMKQLQTAVSFFPKYPSAPASLALRDLIRHSHQDHEDDDFEILTIFQSETKFLTRIQDLVQNFYSEADVRFFRLELPEIQELQKAIDQLDLANIEPEGTKPTSYVKRSLDTVSDLFHEYVQMLNDGNYNNEKLVKMTTQLADVVRQFCVSALSVENSDQVFLQHVFDFQRNFREFISTLKTHSEIGSQKIYSLQAKQYLNNTRQAISKTSKRLVLMEQLDSEESAESSQQALDITLSILVRMAKLLLIARDDLKAEMEKTKLSGPRLAVAESACNSYECCAQTLLTVKNKVTSMTLRIKAQELRNLVYSSQDILDASDDLLVDLRATILDDIESIEFWILASMEPIITALKNISTSIPPSLPQSAIIRRKVCVIQAKCEICVQPFQECRSFVTSFSL